MLYRLLRRMQLAGLTGLVRPIALTLMWALAICFCPSTHAQSQGRTGIPEIDTLPLRDWEVQNQPLSHGKALALSILPGGAQFYGNHPVRGGFLVGLETVLLGLGLSSYLSDLPKWNRDVNAYLDSSQAAFNAGLNGDLSWTEAETKRAGWIKSARERAKVRMQQADLANSEIAWALGLHLYGVLDGQEIVRQSLGPDTSRVTVSGAFWRGLLFPGGGQLYNKRYGKFGMLWMGIGASALSAWSRQQVVEFLNDMVHTARLENTSGTGSGSLQINEGLEGLERDRTLYRKRRNQYYWGITFLYIYSVMDGMVDAALSDFDKPQRFAFGPGEGPLSLTLSVNF
jgi:TM2 domain-containing membrane protein YozV